MILLVLTASATPTYLDSDARFRIPVTVSARDVRRQVRRLRKRSGHTLIWSNDGEGVQILPKPDSDLRFGQLGEAAHLAWVVGLGMQLDANSEWDFIVRPVSGGPTPVTLWSDDEQRLIVAVGTDIPRLPTSDWPTLTERFGLTPSSDSQRFDPELLGAIELAYAALEPEVAQALRDVSFTRHSLPTDREGLPPDVEPGARYLGRLHRIEVYDKAIQRTSRFVGDVDAPHHPLVSLLLHELGHAFTHLPRVNAHRQHVALRDAFEAGREAGAPMSELKRLFDEGEALRATAEALPEIGPLAAAFDQAIGGSAYAPTAYGRTQPSEAFAEAFALHHLDPAALERACPKGAAWFSAQTWEESLQPAPQPPLSPAAPSPERSTPQGSPD